MEIYPDEQTVLQTDSFPTFVAVLIPAWRPRPELVSLVDALAKAGCNAILVVDDGSGPEYQAIFQQLQNTAGVRTLCHARNGGKGRALKTGLSHFLSNFPEHTGVVTADADGQHAVEDIARVATALAEQPGRLILGARHSTPGMPLRSRFGNALTRHVFRALTEVTLADTQTGLRGIPRYMIPEMLAIGGARYEYEMAMLAHYCRSGRVPIELPIRTIYTERNRASHFRPIRDSIHIYRTLARYCLRMGTANPAGMPELPPAEG